MDPPVGRLPVANRNVWLPHLPHLSGHYFLSLYDYFFFVVILLSGRGRLIRSISPLDVAMNDFELGFYSSRFEQVDCHLFQLKSADFPEIIL